MEKIKKKRGRPPINPRVEEIILSRVLDEKKISEENRLPPKVLAHEIRQLIVEKGMRPPAPATLVKRVQRYSSTIGDPGSIDDPWTISSLSNPAYSIPPEALPAVMKARAEREDFSIREALWFARYYCIMKGTEFEYESGAGLVCVFARNRARAEMLIEAFQNIGMTLNLEERLLIEQYEDSVVYSFMSGDRKSMQFVLKEIRKHPEMASWFFQDRYEDESLLDSKDIRAFKQAISQIGKHKGGTR